jgi:hypothetical protein
VSQWISPSALVSFDFTRLLGTEKPLGRFPASKKANLLFAAVEPLVGALN